jgi:hypothetical protein
MGLEITGSGGGGGVGAILTNGNSSGVAVNAASTMYANFIFTGGIAGSGSTWNATEAVRQCLSPVAGTLKNLCVRTGDAQPANGSLVLTVRINGVATAVTITIAAAAAAATFSDTTHTVAVVVGDLISLEGVNASPDAVSALCHQWAILIQ